MANSKSAIKRIRITAERTLRNRSQKSRMRTAIRHFQRALAEGDLESAELRLREASKVIDRVAQKRAIHPNQAARRKSRLHSQLQKAKTGA